MKTEEKNGYLESFIPLPRNLRLALENLSSHPIPPRSKMHA